MATARQKAAARRNIKKAQKASDELPTAVTSAVIDPTASVRTVCVRPLNNHIELFARS